MAIKQCVICGKDYEICKSCETKLTYKPWKVVTDTPEHYKVFLALHNYNLNKDKNKAKELLSACDLSDFKDFKDSVKEQINEIKESTKIAKPAEETVVVEPVAQTTVNTVNAVSVSESEVEQPNRRNKFKKNFEEKPSEE